MKRLTLLLLLAACESDKTALHTGVTLGTTTASTGSGSTTTSGTPSTTTGTTTGYALAYPCEANGFDLATDSLYDQALWDALTAITAPQTCSDYSAAREFMFLTLEDVGGVVTCVYTGITYTLDPAEGIPDHTIMNTEHTWPQSQGAEELPAKCDLHHLYPTDSVANSTRGSHPFGYVVGAVDWTGGQSALGDDAGGSTVFEPPDDHKGNVARSMLYFSARYELPLDADQVALFKEWHALDPVDDREFERSVLIGQEQVLPNPLVVCPGIVERL